MWRLEFNQYRILSYLCDWEFFDSNPACCYHLSLTHCVFNRCENRTKCLWTHNVKTGVWKSKASQRSLQSVMTSKDGVELSQHQSSSAAHTSLFRALKLKTLMPQVPCYWLNFGFGLECFEARAVAVSARGFLL